MTKKFKTILNDEILHFLYSNASFQGLTEQEQQQFLARFQTNDLFKEMVEISISLEETITEVEASIPKIMDKDHLFSQQEQKEMLKAQMVVSGNVYYVPFERLENIYSPIIIALQQSGSMQEFEAFCKGMILPLFNLGAAQKRDLIILPFSRNDSTPIYFKNGIFDVEAFENFINVQCCGEAKLVPVLQQALDIFEDDLIHNQRDLMILTDNQFTDFNELLQSDFSKKLDELAVDVSVIAMSEIDFQVQPITFADKVFFANE